MSATTQCYRHRRSTWIANCPDCTAWHLADALRRRDMVAGTATGSFRSTPRRAPDATWHEQVVRSAA